MIRRSFGIGVLALLSGCGDADAPATGGADTDEIGRGDEEDPGEPVPPAEPSCDACAEGVCDPTTGACVGCVVDGDCGGDAPFCVENECAGCAPGDTSCIEPPPPEEPPPLPPEEPERPEEPGQPEEPGAPEPFAIRFASYNVRTSNLHNAQWGDPNNDWDAKDAERMGRIADEIAAQDLTVVAAQEMRGKERDAVLAGLKKHNQEWGHTSLKQGKDDTVVLFRKSVWSRAAGVEEEHFLVPMQSNLGSRHQVGVLLRHGATGRKVWFYSIHFAAGSDDGAPQARLTAARRTVESIEKRALSKDLPFVLGGDFNTVADGPVGDVFVKAGYKNARKAADKRVNDGCRTFNRYAGSAGKQDCPGAPAKHIDHVWVPRSGMQVHSFKVTATARTSRASDHNPVTAILKKM